MEFTTDYTRVAAESLDVFNQALTALGEKYRAVINVQNVPQGVLVNVKFSGGTTPVEDEQGQGLQAELERTANQHGYIQASVNPDGTQVLFTPSV